MQFELKLKYDLLVLVSYVTVLTAVDRQRRPLAGTTSVSLFFIFYFTKLYDLNA